MKKMMLLMAGTALICALSASGQTPVELPADQNCFIVQAPAAAGGSNVYTIPIDQVNRFWSVTKYGNDISKMIQSDTKWVADVIWQDIDVDGSAKMITLSSSSGTGLGKIGVTINHNPKENAGNVVIGIRQVDKKGNPTGDYLWSWHLWITDFNAEKNFFRYDITIKELTKANINEVYLMDRNLGAKSLERGNINSFGLLYQWGRKDPFVGAGKTAFLAGENRIFAPSTKADWATDVASWEVAGTMAYAVGHPTTFITSDGNPKLQDWMQEPDDYLWTNGKKTIYDPCPKGWKVARRHSWSSGSIENFVPDPGNRGFVFMDQDWYPEAGQRRNISGQLQYVGHSGYAIWTATGSTYRQKPDDPMGYFARSLYYFEAPDGAKRWLDYRTARAHANSVRCMKYNE